MVSNPGPFDQGSTDLITRKSPPQATSLRRFHWEAQTLVCRLVNVAWTKINDNEPEYVRLLKKADGLMSTCQVDYSPLPNLQIQPL